MIDIGRCSTTGRQMLILCGTLHKRMKYSADDHLLASSLQKELYHLALQHASGPVRTSFSTVSPSSAVYQVCSNWPLFSSCRATCKGACLFPAVRRDRPIAPAYDAPALFWIALSLAANCTEELACNDAQKVSERIYAATDFHCSVFHQGCGD